MMRILSTAVYRLLYYNIRLLNRIFFRKVHVYYQAQQVTQGPALVLANHPNGFLDPLLIAAYIKQPVYFLARGDVFNRYTNGILRFIHVLPVYRMREGIDKLGKNADTFDECQKRLANGATILIFAEGLCENNWDLRPMMKGASRIAGRAWQLPETNHLKIWTAGITYQHFDGMNKSVIIQYGQSFEKNDFPQDATYHADFMQRTYNALMPLVCYRPTMQPRSNEHVQWAQFWDAHNHNRKELPQLLQSFTYSETKTITSSFKRIQWIDRLTHQSVFYDSAVYVCWLALFIVAEIVLVVWLLRYLF